jgi:hypothetical protein
MFHDPELEHVRLLNDEARRFLTDDQVFVTRGIAALPVDDQAAILERVRIYDDFGPANNPYGEHDFGAFEYDGHRIFWKVDAYDRDLQYGSPDPSDPRVTRRVLTVMLAGEY